MNVCCRAKKYILNPSFCNTHTYTHICIYVSVYEYLNIHTHICILLYIQIRVEQYILEKKILNLIKLNWGEKEKENIHKTKIQIGL